MLRIQWLREQISYIIPFLFFGVMVRVVDLIYDPPPTDLVRFQAGLFGLICLWVIDIFLLGAAKFIRGGKPNAED